MIVDKIPTTDDDLWEGKVSGVMVKNDDFYDGYFEPDLVANWIFKKWVEPFAKPAPKPKKRDSE